MWKSPRKIRQSSPRKNEKESPHQSQWDMRHVSLSPSKDEMDNSYPTLGDVFERQLSSPDLIFGEDAKSEMRSRIKRAMKAGQMDCIVMMLIQGKHWEWRHQIHRKKPRETGIKGGQDSITGNYVAASNGLWTSLESIFPIIKWITLQGLTWTLSFNVCIDPINGGNKISDIAGLLVSWPPLLNSPQNESRFRHSSVHQRQSDAYALHRQTLIEYWETVCVPKTLQVSDGKERWTRMILRAWRAGQTKVALFRIWIVSDISLHVRRDVIRGDLCVCQSQGRCIGSFNPIPSEIEPEDKVWVLEPKFREVVHWLDQEKLQWFPAFEILPGESVGAEDPDDWVGEHLYSMSSWGYLVVMPLVAWGG